MVNCCGDSAFGMIKDGIGVWPLAGANTYTGTTTVSAGTLQVDGSLGTNIVTVANTATLAGAGTANGSVTIQSGGTLSPGDTGAERFSSRTETWNSDIADVFDMNNAMNGSGQDMLNISGALNLQSAASNSYTPKLVSLTSSNTPGNVAGFVDTDTYVWTIATTSGGIMNLLLQMTNWLVLTNSYLTQGSGTLRAVRQQSDRNFTALLRHDRTV